MKINEAKLYIFESVITAKAAEVKHLGEKKLLLSHISIEE